MLINLKQFAAERLPLVGVGLWIVPVIVMLTAGTWRCAFLVAVSVAAVALGQMLMALARRVREALAASAQLGFQNVWFNPIGVDEYGHHYDVYTGYLLLDRVVRPHGRPLNEILAEIVAQAHAWTHGVNAEAAKKAGRMAWIRTIVGVLLGVVGGYAVRALTAS
ncbi:hypothetical protein J2S43_001396 [Catenuloplanes nepalensis]|uniref:Uncharacterized protein n=1 Tax=Catenuloplanes nepalensis TaxID=587533 RepID=A0ABT9MN76_9ACTN|nr:hypothetical protein [Catenuloplanes nepalensis]MDP9792884.1 hypothetical protein [Catenuloplanes nepalensis]